MELTRTQRHSLISEIVTTIRKKFYDPNVNGTDPDSLFGMRMQELLECPESVFAQEVQVILSCLRANPVKFYHRSQQLVPSRWAIRATFRRYECANRDVVMFQDVVPGGPAYAAGFAKGDMLLSVNGEKPSENLDLPVGQNELIVEKRDRRMDKRRFVVPSQAPSQAVFSSKLPGSVGYLQLTHMPGIVGMDVAREIDVAVAHLRDCDRLIVDLRGNPGGGNGGLRLMSYLTPDRIPVGYSLTRARAKSGYKREELTKFRGIPSRKWRLPFLALKYRFIDHSVVVLTEGFGPQPFHGRVVLLVNEHTVSGAEIIAGFAADHGLATVVGSATAGRLLGWRSFALKFGYVLVIPTGNYLTWEGKSFEGTGVQPHVQVDFDTDAAREGVDVQLCRAIEVASSL